MLHPEIIIPHSEDCTAREAMKKGTITDPWNHTPGLIGKDGLVFYCTGCSAQMRVKLDELVQYSDSYTSGIFE